MENVKQNKKGRKPTINKEQFIQVLSTSNNVEEVLQQLPQLLQGKTMKQAKLYVSMRACHLRKQGNIINKFRTGRVKTTNKQSMIAE